MSTRHVTAAFAGAYLAYLGVENPPSVNLIRSWAHRKKIRRVGTDPTGFALYDLDSIIQHAHARGLVKTSPCARTTSV